MMKTVVVTGATGFIGMALTRKLASNGVKVFAVGRNMEKLSKLSAMENVTAIPATFQEYNGIGKKISVVPDVFYHCAFAGGFDSAALRDYSLQLQNAKYSCDAVSSAISMGTKRFVFASTVNIVEIQTFISEETFSPRYTCVYSTGKLAAELMGKTLAYNHGMEFCTALIAMPYGEGNQARTLPNIIMEQLLNNIRPKLIEGNNLYDLIYIDDVAAGLWKIGAEGRNFRNYYVGHRSLNTFKNWMIQIRDVLSPQTKLEFGEYPDAPTLDYSLIDLEALYQDTGFECEANFDESIRRTAAWLKENEKDR